MKKKTVVGILITAAIATGVLMLWHRSDWFYDLVAGTPAGIS